MFQMIVYLPIEEQCEMFLKKTKRHNEYINKQREILRSEFSSVRNEQNADSTIFISKEKSEYCDNSNTEEAEENNSSEAKEEQSKNSPKNLSNEEELKLIEDYFKGYASPVRQAVSAGEEGAPAGWFEPNMNDMELSLDEGIGSSGSLSNNHIKSSPNSMEIFKHSSTELSEKISDQNENKRELDDLEQAAKC
jgi:hypothetical protein